MPARAGTGGGWALLGSALRPHKKLAWFAAGAGILWALSKLIMPLLLAKAIERGVENDDRRGAMIMCLLMLGAGAVTAVSAGLRREMAVGLAYRLEVDLRGRIYGHAQRLHQAFHDATPTGELMSRTANDLQQIRNPITNGPITLANIVMLLGSAAVLISIDPILAGLALAPGIAMMVLARGFTTRLGPAADRLQRELARVSAIVEETVGGIRAVKGLGTEQAEADKLVEQTQQVYGAGLQANSIRAKFMPAMEMLPALGLVAVLWVGGGRVASGSMSLGELVSVTYYLLMLIQPLRSTGQTIAQLQRALVSASLVNKLLETDPKIVDAKAARPLADSAGSAGPSRGVGAARVELRDVTFGYGRSAPVLRDVNMNIEPGEIIALVGASGAGKTTLTALISRTYDVDSGAVCLDGIDVRTIRLADVRSAVSTVFDETFLFEGSVRDNIAFAEPNASLARVQRAAKLAGAHDFVEALPGGYDALVGGRGRSLSGGQRQRLALARAILPEPRVLILDDVMSAVDPSKEAEMRESLAAVMGGRTTILIAHRAATIRLADRVFLLDGQHIAAVGTHSELMESSERYRAVLAAAPVVHEVEEPPSADDQKVIDEAAEALR